MLRRCFSQSAIPLFQVFDKNQGNSNLKVWERAPIDTRKETLFWSLSDGALENSSESLTLETYRQMPYQELYKISSYEEYWEPILVLPQDAPGFDERFVGFGFCRNSQVSGPPMCLECYSSVCFSMSPVCLQCFSSMPPVCLQ